MTRTLLLKIFSIWIASSLLLTSANADLLYTNGVQAPNDYKFSDVGFSPQFLADDFRLESNSQITRITWSGAYVSVSDDNFKIDILTLIPNTSSLESFKTISLGSVDRTGTGASVFGREIYRYSADVSANNLLIGSSTRYWISIINQTNDGRWNWGVDSAQDSYLFSIDGRRNDLNRTSGRLDFALYGNTVAVPEPSSVTLVTLSAIAFFIRKRSRLR